MRTGRSGIRKAGRRWPALAGLCAAVGVSLVGCGSAPPARNEYGEIPGDSIAQVRREIRRAITEPPRIPETPRTPETPAHAVKGSRGAEVERLRIPGRGLMLDAFLYRPSGTGPLPAIVLLHGCSGFRGRDGNPTRSNRVWAEHWRSEGLVALFVDSLAPRGEKEICTQQSRRVRASVERVDDAYAALEYLATLPFVDARRVFVQGWSNGGTTVLWTMQRAAMRPEAHRFAGAVAFYPGCTALERVGIRTRAPLLIEIGAADDWTPASPCVALTAQAQRAGLPVEIDVYPEAHHGFDRVGSARRYRPEVFNPHAPTGRGATLEAQPQAREQAIRRTTQWVRGLAYRE